MPVLRRQHEDVATSLLDDTLTKVHRVSMANSLQVRVPLLDRIQVEFAFSLPLPLSPRSTDGNRTTTKYLHKRSAERLLARWALDRPKMGLGIPVRLGSTRSRPRPPGADLVLGWGLAWARERLRWLVRHSDRVALILIRPLNWVLASRFPPRPYPNSVLHVSYLVHVPVHTVALLRRHGMRADYLAVGTSELWDQCDYRLVPSRIPFIAVWQEFWTFWRVVARYEVVHAHFMVTVSRSGWEVAVLKRLDRGLVVHFRGCEARDRARNMALHPRVNICQDCDYSPYICQLPSSQLRRRLAARHADRVLVTTPDLLDFHPDAVHLPLLAPAEDLLPAPAGRRWPERQRFKIVHVTVHPGIEGTAQIRRVVHRLRDRGYPVEFVYLHLVPHDRVLREYADADLAIGKLKMGYYANAQIESMAMGVPTVTSVRDEFMTDQLRDSGFIFATLDTLERVLEHYLLHPEQLAEKRADARRSILALHDNDQLARRLLILYAETGDRGITSHR